MAAQSFLASSVSAGRSLPLIATRGSASFLGHRARLAPGCAEHHVSDMLYRPELAQDANRGTSTAINTILMLRMMVSSDQSECRTSRPLQARSFRTGFGTSLCLVQQVNLRHQP